MPVPMAFIEEFRQAMDRSELTLVYQPKFSAHTLEIVGVEALLRWRHPDRGQLAPEEFLPLVREHSLMGPVTEVVLNTALDDAQRWHSAGSDVPVAVNIYAELLGNLDLPGEISQALTCRGLNASALTVEITEDMFVQDAERTNTVLHQLVELGIRIAIDDFGTGYSALAYLCDLPISELKLDHHFVARVMTNRRAAMVVCAITDLAHKLGFVTVAEGIESTELATQLGELGCDVLQGFHLNPPLPAGEVPGLLTAATRA